jgi:hypothetical protein
MVNCWQLSQNAGGPTLVLPSNAGDTLGPYDIVTAMVSRTGHDDKT